ncbi:MAG: LPXTG cell wall anchor domain-containing protein [Microthrixaceae bacterium]
MPAAGFDAAPLLILAGIAVVLALAGFVAIRRRDVYAG